MAITDIDPDLKSAEVELQPTDVAVNPYALDLASEEVRAAVDFLVTNEQPFIDKTTNPDIVTDDRTLCVYKVDSDHPSAVIARAIEGSVIEEAWGDEPEITLEEHIPLEDNSLFFIVIDVTDPDSPIPTASLRIADHVQGPCETVEYYKSEFGIEDESQLPDELRVSEEDKVNGLWDIVSVMVPKEYRDGWSSVWAYHALYKASQEANVHRWISNIVEAEYGNLASLGIPFVEIAGTQRATLHKPGKKPAVFGFYTADVDAIRPSMTARIAELEGHEKGKQGVRALIAKLARIAMDGSYSQAA